MEHIVFNPKWVVPATILAKDVLPALHKDHSYLKKKTTAGGWQRWCYR